MFMAEKNMLRNLSNGEVQQVLTTIDHLHRSDPETTLTEYFYNHLKQTFGNAHYCSGLYQTEPFAVLEHEVPTLDSDWVALVDRHSPDHPIARKLATNPSTGLDFTKRGDFQSTVLYNDVYRHIQSEHQMWITVKGANEILSCIYSREKAYSEQETTMLNLLLPHVEQAWTHWQRTRKLKQELATLKNAIFQSEEEEAAAARLRLAIDALSPRQRDVVECVAAGFDNQQVADDLKISALTVKKHLQAIFHAMDVRHRTELAAKWHRAYSVSLY